MNDHSKPFTPIGTTNWRNTNRLFGILLNDRLQHIYAIGKTGVGKSTLLASMAIDDIHKGHGVAVLDPHGDVAERLMHIIPEHRKRDVIYFDATNPAHHTGLNPLQSVASEQRHLVASEVVQMFKRIWGDTWGARLEYILRFTILTLLEYPAATLLDIQPLLLDRAFRNLVLHYTDNTYIHSFWRNEYDNYPTSLRAEAIMPILNKSGVFAASETLRGIVGQQYGISLDEIMDNKRILICNLSKGIIGEDISQLLGSLLTTGLQMASMRRATKAAHERVPFYIFIDEAHSFISTSFATMLSEVRKYKVGLFLTHQYLEQLPEDIRKSILGNVGTIICFRLGTADAKVMAQEFYPVFKTDDFINLPKHCMYLHLLIDGTRGKPFSAQTVIC
ncbi:type IV secretory system conjugative DNA transfer family protein [Mucilaginibacter boryungensis]|uniref:Type IV secretory system conjugative DNA transfer family protein n=1 Tax=Mucilaginibacter boryungensis TaxID=768480 RepID=A0ABR9XLE4_9SPHI|nr:type IV secretory system conjugative DNA transfer family protein [Mucilaginibacter boryungensis]MBE9668213.1 type IV secretory system conjugative DNA transfer family protein [Mucilaginibacter boryungensis]